MKATRADQKGQVARISVVVEENDYAEKLEKTLKEQRRKASIPGFRPGMAPMSLINKMYRKGALAEVTYHIATDGAFELIKTEAIEPLGDLMPSDEQQPLDFDNNKEFEFLFEVGLSPKIEVEFDPKKDKVEKIVVEPAAEMLAGYTENFLRRFGKLVDVDKVKEDEAVSCTLENADAKIEDAYIGLISLPEPERKPFLGKKVGDKMIVNINEVYKDPKQRAAILQMKEKELAQVNPEFEATITQIRKFELPKLDADFFALAFPEGEVKDQKAFDAKMADEVAAEMASQTEFHWLDTVRDYALAKANLSMPEEFLKNWLFSINEGKFTMEQIDAEFADFLKMMRWDLIKRHIAQAEKMEVTMEDAVAEAKEVARDQFRRYGMPSVADDMLENYAKQILSNKDEAKRMFDAAAEKKVMNVLISKLTVKEKKMSVEAFSKMMEASK